MPCTHFAEEANAARQVMAELPLRERDPLIQQAEASPVRRDMVTLLTYVRDNRVVGTQSTGNLPLKAVGEIVARFVDPIKMEATIGDYTYRVRSEENIWPLHYVHILADVGGLVSAGRARQWRVKKQGEKFLAVDPFTQALLMLSTWWYRVNWLVAYPFEGMGDHLPPFFSTLTLQSLRALPVEQRIAFGKFADRLISDAGLTWTAQSSIYAQMLLESAVERMILSVLQYFAAVTMEYRNKPLGKGTIKELAAFRITPLGEQLLAALAA
jgi:hypothetical protein